MFLLPWPSLVSADSHLGSLMQRGSAPAINLRKSCALACVNTSLSSPRLFPCWDSSQPCHSCKPTCGVSLDQRARVKHFLSLPSPKKKKKREITCKVVGLPERRVWPWEPEGWMSGANGSVLALSFSWDRVCKEHREATSFQAVFRSPLLPGSFSDSPSTPL